MAVQKIGKAVRFIRFNFLYWVCAGLLLLATASFVSFADGLLLLEAESSASEKGEWKVLREGEEHYIGNASGKAHLEFLGNTPATGEPNSPLDYSFTAPADGAYRLLMMSSKRLEGARGDLCNDVWVKMSGNFTSATGLSTEELKNYIKFFQEGSIKTPERSWHWANRAERGKHEFFNLVYHLKGGEKYTLTVAGRSQRFSFDYVVLFDEAKYTLAEAKEKAVSVRAL